MLDPDEIAAYEAWKVRKLAGAYDLSVQAYNAEVGALAAAYEEGAKAVIDYETGNDPQKRASLIERFVHDNPYRKPGMLGHVAES